MEFVSGIIGAETPVDGGVRRVALDLVGCDLAFQSVGVGVLPLRQARLSTLNSISAMLSQLAC